MSSTARTIDASEHPIKSVTVFKSSKAEVVRLIRVPLEAGENKIEIISLPTWIDTESARVTGLGNAQLFDVVCSVGGAPSIPTADSPSEAIRLLLAKRRVLEAQADTIAQIKTHVSGYGESLKAEHVTPDAVETFFDKILSRQLSIDERSAQLQEEILRIQREIDVKTHQMKSRVGSADGRVTVVVMAKEETEAEFKLTYIVTGASWQPTYELHATTAEAGLPSADVSLQYRARITQKTGEDWKGVSLTLSTAPTDVSQDSIPELLPTRIRPPRSPPAPAPVVKASRSLASMARSGTSNFKTRGPAVEPMLSMAAPGSSGGSGDLLELAMEDETWEEPAEAQAMREATTIVKESPLAHAYTVEGSSSVPSDNVEHKVSVATLPFHADVEHVIVPKIKAVAYLQARVKNTSDYRLLPGPVHVFMDDSFVSKTAIKDIAPGDTFDCALGPDAGTRVTYTRLTKRDSAKGGVFSEQFATTTVTARTVVRNTHAYALDTLLVRDGIPISDDNAKVRVLLNKPNALADAKDGEDCEVACEEGGKCVARWTKVDDSGKGGKQQGMYEWACKVGAGEKVAVVAEWTVKAPTDVKWIETEERNIRLWGGDN